MGKIYANGITQKDFVTMLALVCTNFNGILTKLDNDGGVADTDYNATYAVTFPSSKVKASGIRSFGDVIAFGENIVTNFNATCTKLDSDGTVNGTNYNSTLAIKDYTKNPLYGNISPNGWNKGQIVLWFSTIITAINALNAKLDADTGVSGTNYASLWNVTSSISTTGAPKARHA